MNKYSFRSFSQKTLYLAKRRGVKVTQKNLAQYKSAFIDRRIRENPNESVLNIMFRCTYEDAIGDTIYKPNPFLSMIKKSSIDWNTPVILGSEHGVTFE